MLPPTPKQLAAEKFIATFHAEHGFAPSVRELAKHFGVTGPSMQGLLDRLEQRGRIRRVRGMVRTIELVERK